VRRFAEILQGGTDHVICVDAAEWCETVADDGEECDEHVVDYVDEVGVS